MKLGKINRQDHPAIGPELDGCILVGVFRHPGNTNDSIVTMTEERFNELKAMDDINLGIEVAKTKIPDLKSKIRGINL